MSAPGVGGAALHKVLPTTGTLQEQFRRATRAEDLGGGSALKTLVIEAINQGMRTHRERHQRIADYLPRRCTSSMPGNARAPMRL
jgi:hypothetical protein